MDSELMICVVSSFDFGLYNTFKVLVICADR